AVIDFDGDRARDAGEVAANHEDNAKFTKRMREAENDGRENAWEGEWENDAEKRAPFSCAENSRRGEEFRVDRFKRSDQRLNREGEAVQDRREYESSERECQRVAEDRHPQESERTMRTHEHQHVEPEDGGRQHQRQRDDDFQEELPA